MNQACEPHSRNVSAGAIYAIKVPDRLGCLWVVLVKKTAAIFAIKDACESPWRVLKRLDVGNVYNQEVAWLGAFDLEWASQVVNLGQIHGAYILSTVVIPDLAASPVDTLDFDSLSRLDAANCRNYKGN